jgi:hypothetical protein
MLKPRGFVPWGLPGPTRDAAALAASTRNLNSGSPDSVREGDCSDGPGGAREGRGGAHRLHVFPSYVATRTALDIETDPW